ncbi:type IV secretion system protein (plasmid) [Bacillus cereus]|uniref:Type IV secretion system protein n=1 Tax=Bacillus cereus TaxID=1396 RepID=A0AB73UTI8_BACCE|nr:type IV secretion system protein [Bacillus cereus]QHV08159.1 hypothetical protein C1N82_33760 [Bacillus cereus]QHV47691.1 type IV secretion system protein [Bacillus cereus]
MRFKKIILACMVCLIAIVSFSVNNVAFAEQPETVSPNIVKEGNVIRESQKYPEVQYKPMTYVNEKWYWNTNEMLENLKAAWKEIFWFANLLLAKVGCEIVFNLFSLDIVDKTASMVAGVMSATAKAVAGDFVLFLLALTGGYIAIRAYIQQNWREFFGILTKTLISLSLLYSLFGSAQTYVTFGNELSKYMENMALKINPSLTASQKQDYEEAKDGDSLKSSEIGAKIENKVFESMVYKPYLLLNYGTTDEAAITKDEKERINEYLQANEFNEKGLEKRKDIAKKEYEEKGNSTILASNVPSQVGSLFVSFVTNLIQIVVYFILALVRIVLQLAFIVLLIGLPLVLVFSLFPTLENIVMGYVKALFSVISFKALTVFVVLIAVSFLSLGYDLTNMNDKAESRIFTQLLITVATIALWFKRDFLVHALSGQHHRILDSATGTVDKMGDMAKSAFKQAQGQHRHKKTLQAIRGQQEGKKEGAAQGGKKTAKDKMGANTGSKMWDEFANSINKNGESESRKPEAEVAAGTEGQNGKDHEVKNDDKAVSQARHVPNLDKNEQKVAGTNHEEQAKHTDNEQEKVSDSRKPQIANEQQAQEHQQQMQEQEKRVGNSSTEQSEHRSPKVETSGTGTPTGAGTPADKGRHTPPVVPIVGGTTNRNSQRNPNVKNQEQQGNKSGSQSPTPTPTSRVESPRNSVQKPSSGEKQVSGQRATHVSSPTPAPTPTSRVESPKNSVQKPSSGERQVSGQRATHVSSPTPAPTPTSRVESPRNSVQRQSGGGRQVSGQRATDVSSPAPTPTSRVESPRNSVQRQSGGGRRVSGQRATHVSSPAPAPTPTSRVESPRTNVQRQSGGGRRVSGQRATHVSSPAPTPRAESPRTNVQRQSPSPRQTKANREKPVKQPRGRQKNQPSNSIPSLQQDIKREKIKSRVKK